MNPINRRILFILCAVIITVGFSGCSNNVKNQQASIVQKDESQADTEDSAAIASIEQQDVENSSDVYKIETETIEIIGSKVEWKTENNIIGTIQVPVFSGLGDNEFEKQLYDRFYGEINADVIEYKKYYEEEYGNYDKAVADGDKEMADIYKSILESSTHESKILLVSEAKGYFSFCSSAYQYMGGAHGSIINKVYNIDVDEKKVLTLADLFNTPEYEKIILDKLNEIKDSNPEYEELLFPGQEIEFLSDTGFFLSDKSLVIFYQPYDIGSYAAGFIHFNIAYEDVGDILLNRYKDMDVTVVTPAPSLLMNEAVFNE